MEAIEFGPSYEIEIEFRGIFQLKIQNEVWFDLFQRTISATVGTDQ